jgi:uncharacterized RDD family membrane protein YckC
VAARYAKAPSFSQMQAAEAQTAVRAAEIATQVALEAQAVAKAAVARVKAASSDRTLREPDRVHPAAPDRAFELPLPLAEEPRLRPALEAQNFEIRWEPETPMRQETPTASSAPPIAESPKIPTVDWNRLESLGHDFLSVEELAPVEPGQPIHANLIEFPRELVAARKARPKASESAHARAEEPAGQLSIFEVDPGTIPSYSVSEAAFAQPGTFEWSGIELDAHPDEELEPEIESAPVAATLYLAPFSRRLMAAVVDGALITGAFLAAALSAVVNMEQLPALKLLELSAAAALLVTALLYETVFSTLAEATPGMRYAGISLCTFDEQVPTRLQRCGRLGAMLLSLLPLGLGVAWAVFDEDHLSWHDRLSKTYQRKS